MQAKNVPAIEPIQKQIVDAVLADENGRGLEPAKVKHAVERLCRDVFEKSKRDGWEINGLGSYYFAVRGYACFNYRRDGGFMYPGFSVDIKDGKVETNRIVRHVLSYICQGKVGAERDRAEAGNQGIADELRKQFPSLSGVIRESSEPGKVHLDLGRCTLSPDVARAVLALLRDA